MKVLIINGSPRANGNTDIALREMEKVFTEEGVETKRLNIGTQMIHGCVACNACARTGKCGFDDAVNRAADILRDCLDGKHTVRKANKSHTFAYVGVVGNFFGNYIHSSRKRFFCCFNPFFGVYIFCRKHHRRFAVGRLSVNFLR